MTSFHFSLGDSTSGAIGFCARIKAKTKEEAIATLKKALEYFGSELDAKKATGLSGATEEDFKGAENIEYIQVYLNEQAVTEADIDEVTET